jgi:hypothetical protein
MKLISNPFKKGDKECDEEATPSLKMLLYRLDQQQQQLDKITNLAQKRKQMLLNEKIERNNEAKDYLCRVAFVTKGRIAEKKRQVEYIMTSAQRVVDEEEMKLKQAIQYANQTERDLARIRNLTGDEMLTQKEEETKQGHVRNIFRRLRGQVKYEYGE